MKKGLFYAILASILWAIVNPFIKQGLSYDFTPMNFAGIRFTTVGIILFAYTWHKGMWREIRQHSKLFLNLILINMFMGYTAFYFGVDFVSGAISSIIMGMTPLINVLLAHLLSSNDKLNTHKVTLCRNLDAAGYIVRPYKPVFVKTEIKRILMGRSEIE